VAALVAGLCLAGSAWGEVTQRHGVRISFGGELTPKRLPREGTAPIAVSLSTRIQPLNGKVSPQLRRITIGINRHGRIESAGLPVCRVSDVQPSTSAKAMSACGASLVGNGSFEARVLLPEQAPFPSRGRILAFNGRHEGRPAILVHVYGTEPAPTSFTMPFVIRRSKGVFGTAISASLPAVTSEWGYVTGLDLRLERRYRWGGKTRSYVLAGCPAPKGFGTAVFPFAKARFGFGEFSLGSVVTGICQARD
jgi:hypothetical protein